MQKSYKILFFRFLRHCLCLNRGQVDAVELAVEVEGIDVGHGADVVEDTLQFFKQASGMHVVLLRKLVEQQL